MTSNAERLAATMTHRTTKYIKEVCEAVRDNGKLLYEKSKQFTNRRWYSLEQLRQMGHPYARRDPRPPVRPHIINRQTGNLHRNWRWNWARTPDGCRATVYNNAFNARFMRDIRGTLTMIARPVRAEAIKRTKDARARNLKRARRRGYYRLTGR